MINKQRYRDFANRENIPVFSQPWWLDSICGEDNWDVLLYEKGGEIWASFPYYMKNNSILMPKLTQTMGPYIRYPKNQKYYKKLSWEKEIMNYFIDNLPNFDFFNVSFHYSVTNWLPFYWNGFTQTTRYTYVIDKNIDIEILSKNFETDIRRRRKKAENLGISVYESDDIKKFYELNNMTFRRQKLEIPYSFKFIDKLYKNLKYNNTCKIFFAEYEKEIIAANFLIYDNDTVYYLMGGINPDKKDLGAMDVILYESIKFALKSGKNFDFEGSMIESIEKYFRSFGAIQKQYFQISKTNSKRLRFINALKEMAKVILK